MPFSSTQPSLRARVIPRFPAQVLGGSGITISKSGGVYTISADAASAQQIESDRLLGRDTAGTGDVEEITVSGGLGFTGAGGLQLTTNQRLRSLYATIEGSPITTGVKADLLVPFACTISKVTLLADQSGSIVVDIWKDSYANYPPDVGDTITAAAKPTIVTATKSQDSTLTGWTTSIAAGDTLRFNVDSVSGLLRVTVALDVVTV